jgi:glycosyltransferase involved in cell wall biosynthesis
VKVLLVTLYFPPAGGGGVQRPLKFATHLPGLGIELHVLAPDDPKWVHRDEHLPTPSLAWVHRVKFVGPRGRRPADELHGTAGLERYSRQLELFGRRLLFPDENVSFNLTAIPAALRLCREEGIDVVITTSPPGSVHFVGAACKRQAKVRWVADLRDSLVAFQHRDTQRLAVRAKEQGRQMVARLVASQADAIVTVSDAIAAEMRDLGPRGQVVTVSNGSDFDDFAGLEYSGRTYEPGGAPFRITHTGSFFGKRDPRHFLTALARVDGVVARFVGDFRASDREWASGIADRIELVPYAPHRRSLELQRDSEALLLLIPEADGRGRGVLSGKVFEYIAAERPILALVPPDGAAAALLRDTGAGVVVAPEDVDGIARELTALRDRWRAGELAAPVLSEEWRRRVSRRTRVEELAALLERLEARRP